MQLHELHQLFLKYPFISTDTRNILPNSIFFALKGEQFDANTFAPEALTKGAAVVIIDNPLFYVDTDNRYILVENVLETLQKLAQYHRIYLGIPIIALTGSNGKTTTKELIFAVLSQKYITKATKGNLNNHIGVPLTLLSFDTSTEIGIVEMGANHQQEIEFLCTIAKPTYGYITNFGKAHLEGFGGVQGIIKGKSELYKYIEDTNGTLIVNLDDNIQVEKTLNINRFTFSFQNKNADIVFEKKVANPMVEITIQNCIIQSNLIGLYNAQNIAAAITFGRYFKIELNLIKKGIESYVSTNNRSQIIIKNSTTIIMDAYNASPTSMQAALENLINLNDVTKFAILGDMFELGSYSKSEHEAVVNFMKSQKKITTIYIGKRFYSVKITASNCVFFENLEDFKHVFNPQGFNNSMLLIKGSRGMALEKILDWF